MPAAPLSVIGQGTSWAVLQGGKELPRRYHGHDQAQLGLASLQRRLQPIQRRACLCCGQGFNSTGKGNRLCPQCQRNE
jgi:hypothetical protein